MVLGVSIASLVLRFSSIPRDFREEFSKSKMCEGYSMASGIVRLLNKYWLLFLLLLLLLLLQGINDGNSWLSWSVDYCLASQIKP